MATLHNSIHPILYSFRRCPYAMRGRMGLYGAEITVELREIVLRDKPSHMLEKSPKGTVPVLILPNGQVIDESLDIMIWALEQNDPQGWLKADRDEAAQLISLNDVEFKALLDRYKYPGRFENEDEAKLGGNARNMALPILKGWNKRIAAHGALNGDTTSLADIAIFPFVRQFANVDRDWFDVQDLKPLQGWLQSHLDSALFESIMPKFDPWQEGDEPLLFGPDTAPE